MQYLNKFQKELVNELAKQSGTKRINLSVMLQKFLPKDLHIGKSSYNSFCVWYRPDKIDYVQSELSIKILDFVTLINELTTFNYLIKAERPHLATEELKIGKKIENQDYGWIRISANLSYLELEKVFLEYDYFVTEKLFDLKKHNYKQPEEFRADRHLLYLRISVFCSLAAAIISLVALLIRTS